MRIKNHTAEYYADKMVNCYGIPFLYSIELLQEIVKILQKKKDESKMHMRAYKITCQQLQQKITLQQIQKYTQNQKNNEKKGKKKGKDNKIQEECFNNQNRYKHKDKGKCNNKNGEILFFANQKIEQRHWVSKDEEDTSNQKDQKAGKIKTVCPQNELLNKNGIQLKNR